MHIVHVTSSLSRLGGGIPKAVVSLTKHSQINGNTVSVHSLLDQYSKIDLGEYDVEWHCGKIIGPSQFNYSLELRRSLYAKVSRVDIVHSHGLWMYPGVGARRLAEKSNSPLVISPRGMLEPWALARSAWKKRLASLLYERRNLKRASCLHALCEAEVESFRNFGIKNPIAVIPNGIDIEPFDSPVDPEALDQCFPELTDHRLILFLSRVHPKKNLPNLIRSWAVLAPKYRDWKLVIAGPDELKHAAEMKQLAEEAGAANSVVFTGPLYNKLKRAAFARADLFVLPSFSEGFSHAILEAAAARLPVLYTPGCNFSELAIAGGGIEAQTSIEEIGEGLRTLLDMSDAQRIQMGNSARHLVETAYTWEQVTQSLTSVYRWLIARNTRPACVEIFETSPACRTA